MPEQTPATLRTFVGIPLVGDAREAILRLQERMRRDISEQRLVRWERAANLHLTLQFLGDTPREEVLAIGEALERAVDGHRAFDLELAAPTAFGRGKPRVMVVGVGAGADRVIELQAGVVRQLEPLGYPGDQREYHPHATFGRARRGKRRLTMSEAERLNQKHATVTEGVSMRVDEVVYFQSELTPNGAIYTRLATLALTD